MDANRLISMAMRFGLRLLSRRLGLRATLRPRPPMTSAVKPDGDKDRT